MRMLKWHELSPIARDSALKHDSDCGWQEEATYLNWWEGEHKPGGPVLLYEDGVQRIQLISWLDGKCYWLLRLHSTRIIARLDYEDLPDIKLLAKPSDWLDKLMEWVRYWDNFDREQCALSVAEKEGMSPKFRAKVLYEAKRIDGWFLRYRRADDIYEFTKRENDGLVYFYTGEYFLRLPEPPLAGQSDDSGSADSAAWQA